jgi:uncharacterized membrane protein
VSDPGNDADRPSRDLLDKTFTVALILKGLDGLLELVGGILLLVISPDTLNHLAQRLTQHELSEDPHDFFAHHLLHLTANLHNTQTFGALYLLTHGVVKLVIVVGLLRRAHWAYYVAFVVLGGFVIYQIYRMTYAPSAGLALLTAFDLFIIWLTWREFVRVRENRIRLVVAATKQQMANASEFAWNQRMRHRTDKLAATLDPRRINIFDTWAREGHLLVSSVQGNPRF